jgi:hypothetical protein
VVDAVNGIQGKWGGLDWTGTERLMTNERIGAGRERPMKGKRTRARPDGTNDGGENEIGGWMG